MRNLLTSSLLVLLPFIVYSQDKVSDYISNYQYIAISEMNRSGIPASITLAQGMFESAYGQSPSAVSYNNHFGIKCKKEWTGPYFYKHDDDRDKNGKLIPSCFRAYSSVDESFQDHTNFLVERERYAELFYYAQTDYHNWALGLEKCGYATNKMYAERLIAIIERYELNRFDSPNQAAPAFVSSAITAQPNADLIEVATDAFSDITSSSDKVDVTTVEEQTIVLVQEEIPSIVEPEVQVVTSTDPMEEAVDAFANVTSADIDEILLAQFEKETINIPLSEPVVQEDENSNTLEVLNSFEEFTSVTPAIPAEVIPKSTAPSIIPKQKVKPATTSRVNRAIILPENYRRKAESTSSESTKMDKR